ncbi:hypothetical protein ANN_06444 [Periplaneta americana]|uniref:Uncharacterized protein n=1 Tax=Periplaneta americana TaxID=6978 RepID=A0ABQ8TFB8_PERAM|nr:hypothetical protein ANN_06444 [Periplaneta americana]
MGRLSVVFLFVVFSNRKANISFNMMQHFEYQKCSFKKKKINVWADIFGDDIVGPIFIEENLTGELYVNVSENVIDPLITLSLENQVNEGKMVLDEQNLHFQ